MRQLIKAALVVATLTLGIALIATTAVASARPSLTCKKGYHAAIAYKTEKVKGKLQKVAYLACVKTTVAAQTTSTTINVTSNAVGSTQVVVATLLTTGVRSGSAVTKGTWSIGIIDAANGSTLGTWTTTGSANVISTGSSLSISWTYTTGTMTLGSPTSGVTWSGPVTIAVNPADATSLNIAVQGSYGGSTGFAASKSSARSVVL